jgi:CheY-specific phosphatase CheX
VNAGSGMVQKEGSVVECDVRIPDGLEKRAREYYGCIAASVSDVFGSYLGVEAEPGRLFSRRLGLLPGEVIITVEFTADVRGYIGFFLGEGMVFDICSRLSPDLGNAFIGPDHLDVVRELANIIAGNTLGRIDAPVDYADLAPPELSAFYKITAVEKNAWSFSAMIGTGVGDMGILIGIIR